MNIGNENQNTVENLLGSSQEIWDFLRGKAGLDVKNYDLHIVEELCKQLSIPPNCKDIARELQERSISSELFIGAFLKAIQPYAQMMSNLCVFFYLHGVKKTNKEMKVLFDFGNGPEDLGFDLKHFREILWKFNRIFQQVTIYGWNTNTLWTLARIFEDFRRYNPSDPKANEWLSHYVDNQEFSLEFPVLPTVGIKEIDLWLQRVWQVWTTIILECRKYGSSRTDLEHHANMFQRSHLELTQDEESYESLRRSQELPDFGEWDGRTLYFIDSDRWPETMLRGLLGFTENLLKFPNNERMEKAQPVLKEIQELFSRLPHWEGEREELIKEVLELLNLPIWTKRHELYQTWVLTQIDRALEGYQRVIHHVNDTLILRFSGTQIGSIETEKGRIHIWSELRSPLANPLGKGRKRHIQPDYSLTFEPITDPNQTVIAIECKQYRKANLKNFSNALIDYAKGRPNARVVLVNYGEIPEKILNYIDDQLRRRTLVIGNFLPGNLTKVEIFKRVLIESIPKPDRERQVKQFSIAEKQFALIVVDVSGSMERVLTQEKVKGILQMIVHSSPSAKLLAIDATVKKEWIKAETGLHELFALLKRGATDIPRALRGYDLEKSVVLTDDDGWEQLSASQNLPYLVIEVSGIDVNFHFRD
ncbi:hypothetical protein HYR99_34995 [Candidatus Poribacteria bacterium]|nr:hypothetical protein [Candidatus Poribacteria bacterium]